MLLIFFGLLAWAVRPIQSQATTAGVGLTLTEGGIDYVNQALLQPTLQRTLDHLTLPDVSGSAAGIKYTLSQMYTHDFVCSNCSNIAIKSTGIHVGVENFNLQLHIYVHYKVTIISSHTKCTAKLKNSVLAFDAILGENQGHLTLGSQNIAVDLSHFSLSCSGLSGAILDGLESLFKSSIVKSLQDTVKSSLQSLFVTGNAYLANLDMGIAIPGNVSQIRFDFVGSPRLSTGNYVTMNMLGQVVPQSGPVPAFPYAPPALPGYEQDIGGYLQLEVSAYTLETAAYTYWKAGVTHGTIKPSDVPAVFPIQLNTNSLGSICPGLPVAYPNMDVQIFFSVVDTPKVEIDTTGATTTVPVSFEFQPLTPQGPVTAFTLECAAGLAMNLAIVANDAQALTGNLTLLSCQLVQTQSSVGDVKIVQVAVLVNFILDVLVLPVANLVLNQGLPLPTTDAANLTHTKLSFQPSVALIGTEFIVAPPAWPEARPLPAFAPHNCSEWD